MADFSCLCPGYKQVDAFSPDDEYEEEEVTYVTLDLGTVEPTLLPSSSSYRLIGLDSPSPFLQLSGTIFKGRHDTLLGTELLFTEGKDAVDRSKRSATHVANTEQRICFKEVQLKPKKAVSEPVAEEDGGWRVDQLTGNGKPVVRVRHRRTAAQIAADKAAESSQPQDS